MTQLLQTTFTAAVLSAAVLFAPEPSFAYGEAVPMGVIGIEAMAPVTSLDATTTETITATAPTPASAALPVSILRSWIAAVREYFDDAVEVALR